MTSPVDYVQRWHQLIAPRAQVELDRLSIAIKLDAQVYPLVSKAERLSVGFCAKLPHAYGYVSVPCDSEAAALELSQCPQWVEWFAPFRGELSAIVFKHPDGSFPIRPVDPRRSVLGAAYRSLLSEVDFQGSRLNITDPPWVPGSLLICDETLGGLEDYPIVALSVDWLKSLNAFYQHWDALHRFALAAVPNLKTFQCLVLTGESENPLSWDALLSEWVLAADGQWQFDPSRHSSQALAKALLFEAGLRLPVDEKGFERLFVDIKDEALMAFGSSAAVEQVSALIPRLVEHLGQLHSIPLLRRLQHLTLSSPSIRQTIPLTPGGVPHATTI